MPAENEREQAPNEMTSMNGTTESLHHGSIQPTGEPGTRNGHVTATENQLRTVGEGPVDV